MNSAILELVRRLQDGDEAAFREIYDLYARKVLNFCYRLTGSREMAEDAAQETFISVFRSIGGLQDLGRFEPWLFMIARNFVYQAYRRTRHGDVSTDETDNQDRQLVTLEAEEGSPEDSFLKEEFQAVAMRCIQELDLKYREVFVLAVLEGYSYKETAEMVGRRIQSVKTDIHRARLQIRERFTRYLQEGRTDDNV